MCDNCILVQVTAILSITTKEKKKKKRSYKSSPKLNMLRKQLNYDAEVNIRSVREELSGMPAATFDVLGCDKPFCPVPPQVLGPRRGQHWMSLNIQGTVTFAGVFVQKETS